LYGDPSAIRRLAGRLLETADEIRTEADRLVSRTDAVGWLGPAGDALRERVRERALALRRSAALHDDAVDALEHHAREVERFQRLIEEVERRVLRFVEAARGTLDDGLDGGLDDGLGAWVDHFEPPPRGSRLWLAVDAPTR